MARSFWGFSWKVFRRPTLEAKHKEITRRTQAYIIAIDVEHITGKEAIEYVNAKR